ncbi:MAG TPA: protein-L-isoaspartate(D-aspartate) O-methyltransferase [Bryobacteraceae bacterium]|nr:protein-L-isoaspartate(D-aspartate) O-methyltransferase [Bryobacteraceae bacterium]
MLTAEHIEHRGIRNPDVLRAMRSVPRHEFVPAELAEYAYEDKPLDIGYGVTISQPYIVAAMSELLEVSKRHRVLEIGAGSGYQSAILSELAGEVFSIEIVPELAHAAAEKLASLGYLNVRVKQGDGYTGWPEGAPFDRIILTAAPVEAPPALLDQLAPNGRLVAPVGADQQQELVVIGRSAQGQFSKRVVFPVLFVPMIHSR